MDTRVVLAYVSITIEDLNVNSALELNIIVICVTKHIHRKAILNVTKKQTFTNLCVSLNNK
jgi:hypothetical protein